MGGNLRDIINGGMLPQFNGKKVSIIGLVTNVNPNGLTFDLRSTDNVSVKVNLRKPYRDHLQGNIEVQGTAQGSTTIICDNLVIFSPTESSDFDAASHNVLCTLLHSISDPFKTKL